MIQISSRQQLWKFLQRYRGKGPVHYTRAQRIAKVWFCPVEADETTVAAWPSKGRFFAFDTSVDGDPITEHYFESFEGMAEALIAFLLGVHIEEGVDYEEEINQGVRTVEVLAVKRARFRVEFDMPNIEFQQGWRHPCFKRHSTEWYYRPKGMGLLPYGQ
jgi:hypothetical protein